MALRKEFFKKISFAEKLTRIDAYLYFFAINSNFKYLFNPNVTVVDSKDFSKMGLGWFIKIQNRSTRYPKLFYEKFSIKKIKQEEKLTFINKIFVFSKIFTAHPLNGFIYILFKSVSYFINLFQFRASSHLWRKK